MCNTHARTGLDLIQLPLLSVGAGRQERLRSHERTAAGRAAAAVPADLDPDETLHGGLRPGAARLHGPGP